MSNRRTAYGRPFHRSLAFWVLTGLVLGAALGAALPRVGAYMHVLPNSFLSVIVMLIAPLVFTTVVSGIAALGDLRRLGRISVRALLFFEVSSTLALVIGLLVGGLLAATSIAHGYAGWAQSESVAPLQEQVEEGTGGKVLEWLVPESLLSPFTSGNALHALTVAVLFGLGLACSGRRGQPVLDLVERLGHVLFNVVRIVATAAPIAAFGGAAYTVSQFGTTPLRGLLILIVAFCSTCAVVILGLGALARLNGFSLPRLLRYIKAELLVVVGTSSSEPAFPGVLRKLEAAGAQRSALAPVLAGGYSLHMIGSCVYLTMAASFVASATNVRLSFGDYLLLLALSMVTSKSAVGVTGSGLLTLVATLTIMQSIPVQGVGILIGIDRLMSEVRALTNLIGNSVAALVIAKWTGQLDGDRLRHTLETSPVVDPDHAEDDPSVVEIEISR